MSVESAFYTYLTGLSAVTSLVSTRIYPSQAAQGASLPYVVHHRISEQRYPHVLGPSGLVRLRLQVDVFGATLDSALGVFDVLRDNLNGWLHADMDDLRVQSITLDDVRTDFTPPSDGGDPGVHRVSTDWIWLYGESGTSV